MSGAETVLIDAGCGLSSTEIAARIAAVGPSGPNVSRIFITHSHADHAAGASELHRLTGARIHAPAASAAAMRAGDSERSLFTAARAAGSYPPDLEYPTIPGG